MENLKSYVFFYVVLKPMPTVFLVDSGRCGWKTRIKAELASGGKIMVAIDSTCANVKKYGEALKEVSMRDIGKPIMTNPVYIAANGTVGPECLVPCAVISTVWTEAGLVSKNLLKRFSSMCITYDAGAEGNP